LHFNPNRTESEGYVPRNFANAPGWIDQPNNMEVEQLQNSVAKAIRSSIFSLAYHIWEGRN